MAGVFDRLPATLEKQPLLRVHQLRFARINTEELGVEEINIVKNRARRDKTGVVRDLISVRNIQILNAEL